MSDPIVNLQDDLKLLERNLYIVTGVLSVILFLVIVLCIILYYWVNTLEKKVTEDRSQDFRIKRAQLREKFPQNQDSRDSTLASNYRYSSQPADLYNQDKNYRNPLGSNNGNQQIAQNQRSSAVIDEIRRNPRHTEQQLHQNFYGMDNGNFQY